MEKYEIEVSIVNSSLQKYQKKHCSFGSGVNFLTSTSCSLACHFVHFVIMTLVKPVANLIVPSTASFTIKIVQTTFLRS